MLKVWRTAEWPSWSGRWRSQTWCRGWRHRRKSWRRESYSSISYILFFFFVILTSFFLVCTMTPISRYSSSTGSGRTSWRRASAPRMRSVRWFFSSPISGELQSVAIGWARTHYPCVRCKCIATLAIVLQNKLIGFREVVALFYYNHSLWVNKVSVKERKIKTLF